MSEITEISVLEERRKYGVFITRIAWTVEVFACITGFLIALNFSGVLKNSFNSDSGIIAITFAIIAIVELTKIPLVTSIYFAISAKFKLIFSILLFLVCLGTFETLIQGFELSQKGRTAEIDKLFQKINSFDEEISGIEISLSKDSNLIEEIQNTNKTNKNSINSEYEKNINDVKSLRDERLKGPEGVLAEFLVEKRDLIAQGDTSGQIKVLKDQIITLNTQITESGECIVSENNTISELKRGFGALTNVNQIKDAEDRRSICEGDQINYKNRRNTINKSILQAGTQTAKGVEARLKIIDTQIQNLNTKIKVINDESADNIGELAKTRDEQLSENSIDIAGKKIGQVAISENKPERIARIKEIEIEKSKLEADFETIAYDNQMYRISKKLFQKEKFTEVTQRMVSIVFFLWFGTIAVVVALVGPGLALAGLTLRDRRVKEEDVSIIKRPKKFINALRKTLAARRKSYNTPKIKKVYEIKEVEVVKEVPIIKEVIIEKEVIKRVPVKEIKIKYMPIYVDEPPENEK